MHIVTGAGAHFSIEGILVLVVSFEGAAAAWPLPKLELMFTQILLLLGCLLLVGLCFGLALAWVLDFLHRLWSDLHFWLL